MGLQLEIYFVSPALKTWFTLAILRNSGNLPLMKDLLIKLDIRQNGRKGFYNFYWIRINWYNIF